MPLSPAQPIPANISPAMAAAFARIDRECDPWHLPNFRNSILGDARIYVANERIRENALSAVGIVARDHGTVREALRAMMTCERRDVVRFRRLASMLVGERRLDGLCGLTETKAIAQRFAARAA